jgi:hypothetical protein
MNAPVPLLLNHDYTRAIGKIEYDPAGRLQLTFTRDHALTRSQFFEVFGNCGVRIDAWEYFPGETEPRVARATILEWSVSPQPAMPDSAELIKTTGETRKPPE